MKKIILALLTIFAIQSSLQAQVAVQINDSQQNLYERKVITFNKMKRAGIGLTIGGAVLAGVGTGLLIDYFDKYDNRYYDYGYDMEDLDMEYAIGVGLTSIGITAVGGGITLWSIGAAKSKSYKRKLDSFSFNLSPGYRQQFSLAYRF
ncbi:MAG: hypothetical protein AB9833_08520 [Bacteroidales bacterium]